MSLLRKNTEIDVTYPELHRNLKNGEISGGCYLNF